MAENKLPADGRKLKICRQRRIPSRLKRVLKQKQTGEYDYPANRKIQWTALLAKEDAEEIRPLVQLPNDREPDNDSKRDANRLNQSRMVVFSRGNHLRKSVMSIWVESWV
jgi:hypothetical protein